MSTRPRVNGHWEPLDWLKVQQEGAKRKGKKRVVSERKERKEKGKKK